MICFVAHHFVLKVRIFSLPPMEMPIARIRKGRVCTMTFYLVSKSFYSLPDLNRRHFSGSPLAATQRHNPALTVPIHSQGKL
jgi:hypothetical protein